MLETRNFGGKCGDLNALFVGLSGAAGIPARGRLDPLDPDHFKYAITAKELKV